jgi:hypothetical protein
VSLRNKDPPAKILQHLLSWFIAVSQQPGIKSDCDYTAVQTTMYTVLLGNGFQQWRLILLVDLSYRLLSAMLVSAIT